MSTLQEAIDYVKNNAGKGVYCPCCEQFAKIYKRKLNSGMAASLVWLVRTYLEKQNWIYVWKIAPKFILRSAEIGKLAHWELAIQKTNEDDDSKRTSGLWKPTEKGIKFVRRRISVPSHVFLYDNHVQGFTNDLITIDDALGNKFNYRELMQPTSIKRTPVKKKVKS